ncbi:hypothetical protein HF1_04160 [Mycoplasma haemofelis str. Langford 1]|uniref:Uncharacterized protein n=1 Tax=Mycoplasma haemofelis (strain Langford 1) TaxID=941640 RepID=E8ZH03_MYCHL|nr:hypothetical protein HF1_04160 [Mycoplasma haemofelis str. Langford 1]
MDPLKAALTTAGIGGVGLGTYGLYNYGASSNERKENIGTRLVDEKFGLLNNSHTDHWQTSLKKYKEKKSSESQSIDEAKLKSLCAGILSKDKNSEEDYKTARRYCVVPQNVSTRLSKLSFKVLNATDETHKTHWEKLATTYVTQGKGDKQIESLSLETTDT